MRTGLAWAVLTSLTVVGLWQLVATDPWLPSVAAGLMLLLTGTLAGLRWGADSSALLIAELVRTNRYLGAQNQDLADLNQAFMHEPQAHHEEHAGGLPPH